MKAWWIIEQKGNYIIKLFPRAKLDLPAYKLNAYEVRMNAYREDGTVIDSSSVFLRSIFPGDPPLEIVLKKMDCKSFCNKIALVNPNGIELMDTVWYNSSPRKPEIKEYRSVRGYLRIYLKPTMGAMAYWAQCEDVESGKILYSDTVSVPTHLDIRNLKHKKKYNIRLFASNNKGTSSSASILVEGNESGEMVPEVKKVQGFSDGSYIALGYSCDKTEYLFEVEYAESDDMKVHVRRIFTDAKGACFIPNLEKGRTYYVRMRSYYQYQQVSEWSPIYMVVL